MLIEVCCNSLESALNSQKAGANRIELCSELGVGGITPSHGLLQMVRNRLSIPIHVLIRPRSGHFTYTEHEFEVMQEDIRYCKEIGANGIVLGVLNKDATLDLEWTRALVALAAPLPVTFHRAFDWIPDPEMALEQLESIGVSTVLTSGTEQTAENGLHLIKKWQVQTKMTIMAGAGITPMNFHLFKTAGLRAIHLSGTSFGNEVTVAGKISMNSQKHLAEHHIALTDEDIIRHIVRNGK